MRIKNTAFAYNVTVNGSSNSDWGTDIGQGNKHTFTLEGFPEIINAMVYYKVEDVENLKVILGKGNRTPKTFNEYADTKLVLASRFTKIFVNGIKLNGHCFIMYILKETNEMNSKGQVNVHLNRCTLKFSNSLLYKDEPVNQNCINAISEAFGLSPNGSWAILEMKIENEDELHLYGFAIGDMPKDYNSTNERNNEFARLFDKQGLLPVSQTVSPLQQIYYGAPGTGKSHGINELTKGKSVIRTTFHPDSDYSTFVGCYKPTKEYVGKKLNKNLSFQDLANILNGYYNDPDNGHIGGLQKFVYEYVSYLNGDIMNVNVTQLLQQAGVGTSYNVEINKYVKFCTLLPKRKESRITYEFVAQAFTKAYVLAWQEYLKGSEKPVFLIIEEINRGNCAQIFGDLFQLLDRSDDGFSSYPIKSDTDLGNFIAEEMSGFDSQEYASIINGDELLLPPNLYIWATMNTSDQSLFPIDSAFKRRWDWVYIPINIEAKTGWHIDVNDKKYKWSSFLEKINNEIEVTTSSEDKQLGFFFCKAEETDANGNNGKITAERFVSKVLFYLYNDVFKDYGLDQDFFKDKVDGKPIAFRSLFKMDGSLNEERVEMLLENLGVEEA